MCTAICNCLRSVGGAILSGMDSCAIKINRCSPCVRKTISAAVIVVSPTLLFCGLSTSYVEKIPKEAGGILIATVVFPMLVLTGCLFKRYGWLMRPLNHLVPPESVRTILAAEVAKLELPQEYRDETERLLQQMDEREQELERLQMQVSEQPAQIPT